MMGSKLFQVASAAVQEAARRGFRRTQFARTIRDLERAARGGALSNQEIARFSRRLSGLTGKRVAGDLLQQMGLEEVSRYAKKTGSARAWGGLLEAIGPVGKLIRSFLNPGKKGIAGGRGVSLKRELAAAGAILRAFGHVVLPGPGKGSIDRENQKELANLLRSMGWKVSEPDQGTGQEEGVHEEGGQSGKPQSASGPFPKLWPKKNRKTTDVDFGGPRLRTRIPNSDPLLTGEMIPVTSSNVHSIGFRLDANDRLDDLKSSKGTLLIRFLSKGAGGKKTAPGPFYEYYDVPAAVFQAFRKAASKGGFVWDNVRVRGTVSGHKYAYDLAGIVGGYVPRQAGLKRGANGEWYLTRRFRDGGGNVYTSRLPEQQVKLSGPNRALPNRGTPERGSPNRGRE